MKPRHLIFLSLLFLALAAAVVVQKIQAPRNQGFEITRPLNLSFEKEKVQSLRLTFRGEAVEILKKDDAWFIATEWNTRAGAERVDSLLNQLMNLRGELRSTDPELLKDYGIQDEEAVRVELYGPEKRENLLTLLLGTGAAESELTFVRKPGSAEVFAVERPLLGAAGLQSAKETGAVRESGFWNDLRLFKEDTADIRALVFRRGDAKPGAVFSLVKAEQGEGENKTVSWAFGKKTNAFEPDPRKIEDLLQLLAGARALKAVNPAGDYGLDKPLVELELTLQDKKKVRFRVSSSGEETKSYFIQSSEDSAVFEVSLYHVKRLDLTQRHFFLENPFSIESSQIQQVLLQRGSQERFAGQTEDRKEELARIAGILEGLDYEVRLLKSAAVWTQSEARLEAHAAEDQKWQFDFGPQDVKTKEVPFRLAEDSRVFAVSEKTFQALFSSLAEAKAETVPVQESQPELAAPAQTAA